MHWKATQYKQREKEKYDDWVEEMDSLNFPVYVVAANSFWAKEIADRMSDVLGRKPVHITKDLKKYTDKMRYRSLMKKKQFVWFERTEDGLKKEDIRTLEEYLPDPSNNGMLVVSLPNRKAKNEFLKEFRMIRKSDKIKLYEMEYVSDYFKELYVRDEIRDRGIVFKSDKLKTNTIKNLILNMDEVKDNLMTLQEIDTAVIEKEDVQDSIENYSDSNIRKLYDSLAKLNRKNVPYKVARELLDEGVKPEQILRGMENHFKYLYQAKYLKLRGILRENDQVEERKKIYEKKKIIFPEPSIFDLSKTKRNRYLRDVEDISSKEILEINRIIESHVMIHKTMRKGEDYYVRSITEEGLWSCMIDIMNRLEQD